MNNKTKIHDLERKLATYEKLSAGECHRLLKDDLVFLDTETTGLDDTAELIEIAIVDKDGSVLINQRIRPTVAISGGAYRAHGISAADLADCPTWPAIADQVRDLLRGKVVVIFNANYDTRILEQTESAFGRDHAWVDDLATHCAMYAAAGIYGATNRYGTISLVNATKRAGVRWQGEAHSALGDTLATRDLFLAMAELFRAKREEITAKIRALGG